MERPFKKPPIESKEKQIISFSTDLLRNPTVSMVRMIFVVRIAERKT